MSKEVRNHQKLNNLFKRVLFIFCGSMCLLLTGHSASLTYKHKQDVGVYDPVEREKAQMITSATNYLKTKEGFRATPYRCSAGARTIGYGDTTLLKANPKIVRITEEEAFRRLRDVVEKQLQRLNGYEVQVGSRFISYSEALKVEQKVSLISFMYNLGEAAFSKSTLRQLIDKKVSIEVKLKKDYHKNPLFKKRLEGDLVYVDRLIREEFVKWSKIKEGASYKKIESLEARRREEAKMFLASS